MYIYTLDTISSRVYNTYTLNKNPMTTNKPKKDTTIYWSPLYKLYECKVCHSNKKKHHCKGMCSSCAGKKRYRTDLKFREQLIEATKRYKKKHPNRYREQQKRSSKKWNDKNRKNKKEICQTNL